MGTHKNTYIHTLPYIHTYIHCHTYIHTYTAIHTYIHTYIHCHTYIHTLPYIHTYTAIHTYRHCHTYIHTHTCTTPTMPSLETLPQAPRVVSPRYYTKYPTFRIAFESSLSSNSPILMTLNHHEYHPTINGS